MTNSKHIFLQINADKIAELANMNPPILDKMAVNYCLIYDQGSMATGDPIKKFQIEIEKDQNVYFTILPLYLFSRNKLYFTGFNSNEAVDIPMSPEVSADDPQCSFLLETDVVDLKAPLNFTLDILLEYQTMDGSEKTYKFSIDPVLQVKQD